MNQRIKKLWVKALRSGKFSQVTGKLRKRDGHEVGYCCLGVLESLCIQEIGGKFKGGLHPNQNLLSAKTMEWAGLNTNDPVLMPRKHLTASELNDDGNSFASIADRIEKYL
jgi:hypothetical protein